MNVTLDRTSSNSLSMSAVMLAMVSRKSLATSRISSATKNNNMVDKYSSILTSSLISNLIPDVTWDGIEAVISLNR